MKKSHLLLSAVSMILAIGLAPAADEKELGWSDTAEFSLVSTSGNSESSTLGFKNTATRRWESAMLEIRAGAIRAEQDTITRYCLVANPDGTCADDAEISSSEVSAENYFLNGKYGRNITDTFFWYAGLGWDRNRPAGIKNRYLVEGGVGNIWNDSEDLKFRTDYALTYTDQEDYEPLPDADDNWVGARFAWTYLNKFGKNTTYENLFTADLDLEETSNWRGDMINSLAVSMNSRLALKVSLQWLYENDPAYVRGDSTLGADALIQLDKLDSIFTASLVVNF